MATIVCKLKRPGGSKVTLNDRKYHFKPAADFKGEPEEAIHTAEVTEPQDIHRFLKIKEAYCLLDPDEELPPQPTGPLVNTIAGAKAAQVAEQTPVFIESSDGTKINLSDMTFEDLKAMAHTEFKVKVHPRWNRTSVTDKILEAVRVLAGEQ
jgi:hypothetical protein